ncbi:hypothetical protein JRO89_XSUnG0209600 [Xanthoceras sorbifolium]|uniref:Uncharacterized protein n=1 Tax=Xanthoceras sorbifolium TaxID=99658 RepID=A0ABQ8GX26_9ROSI|nr:hypothetical protein JRO89_XSUnG0209600 [Xanthoceras sorbifolium]
MQNIVIFVKKVGTWNTREVYEEKLNLQHDPTMNPGLDSPRCPRCLSLLNPNSDQGEWTITSVVHDATGVGLVFFKRNYLFLSLFLFFNSCKDGDFKENFGFDTQFKLLLTCEFVGYVLPKFAQLTVTSYYAASSASHYGISLLTRHIEEAHTSRTWQQRLR